MSVIEPTRPDRGLRKRALVAAALVVWLAAIACGWRALTAYAFKTNGVAATVPATWPDDSQLPHYACRSALVVFLHPKCPCSRATLTELERLLIGPSGAANPAVQVIVAAVTPSSHDSDWTATPLMERSRRLPAAEVFVDRGGVEAERFGAVSSGTVIFFDADGRRRYFGGVTMARGHEGQNLGEGTLARLMAGDNRPATSTPAFGCRLVSEHRCVIADELVAASIGSAPPTIAATANASGARANE